MAIHPLLYAAPINVDVLKLSSFKAGMALIKDSNGRAIKADSQALYATSVTEKLAKFIGFAASDHDINNTIIVQDIIGSSYTDANNQMAYNNNTEYSIPKRGLLDLQDETVSRFYNPSNNSILGQRGVGVHNTPGDIFITDQFNPVLHGDLGFDSTTVQTITPGDLLTFGGGINAGKLVKINVNSIGPDVLVVAIVEKYIPQTGLLHFRQVNYGLIFGSNPYILAIDAGNNSSYVPESTSVTNLALKTFTGTLINGTSYSSLNTGSWSFDGTNDAIDFSGNTPTISYNNFSFEFIAKPNASFSTSPEATSGTSGFGKRYLIEPIQESGNDCGFGISLGTNAIECIEHGAGYLPVILSYSTNLSGINHFCVVVNNKTSKLYINGIYIKDGLQSLRTNTVSRSTATLGSFVYGSYSGLLYKYNSYNRALSAAEVLNLFNSIKSRYGL